MTPFLTPRDVARIVAAQGIAGSFERLAGYLAADYRRWPAFDKTPRVAAHSPDGVIELMPIADARSYSFKYVNGHPKNTAAGLLTVDADAVDRLNRLDESVTLATLPPFVPVRAREMVATIKIIPFAAPREALAEALAIADEYAA